MMHKPMEPDKTNLCVPRKQVEEVAELLPIFDKPRQFSGVLSDWELPLQKLGLPLEE